MDEIITSVTAGLIIAAVSGLCGVLWQQLKTARRSAREHETLQDERMEALGDGVRELLLCKLESMRRHMVYDNHGIADETAKAQSQRIYDAYHRLHGNGHGTMLNHDIQTAPIAPRQTTTRQRRQP